MTASGRDVGPHVRYARVLLLGTTLLLFGVGAEVGLRFLEQAAHRDSLQRAFDAPVSFRARAICR